MKSKKRTIWILIVVIVVLLGFASSLLIYRNKLSSDNVNNKSGDNIAQSLSSAPSGKSIENFYDKPITDEKIALDSIEVNRNKLGYSDKNFTFIYDKKSGSETAYHFDLYYKGIPVYSPVGIRGVSVITHYDKRADVLITGVSDSEKITKVNTTPKITQDESIEIAKKTMNTNSDIELELILYEINDSYTLAYYYCGLQVCIINAETGEVIKYYDAFRSNIDELIGQNGDVHQVFYDNYTDGNFDIKNALWEKEKNIFVHNNISSKEEIKNNDKLLTIDDLQLGKNKSAIDGMANTYRAVEYFERHFDKKFDSTHISVNVDTLKVKDGNVIKDNACGGYLNLEGNNVAYLFFPFTSNKKALQYSAYLDIVAHEFTHAITVSEVFGSYSKDDSKYYECNALGEAYSDIFGQLIEQEYTGQTDWKQNLTSDSYRDLAKKEKNKEYKYKYNERYTGANDDGGAHYNSTIISHTAYLMSKDNYNNDKNYDTEFLLDYNQLGQLWYNSLEYLNKTDFMDFADCRWAIEESARDLIEKGVLLENNLKIIEQAFNEVEVISNPTRHGAENSAKIIKDKHTLVVPIEDETQSSEIVEITEIPTSQISAIDLIDKSIPEIISLMNGKYQIIKTENDGYIYIQNQSAFPGMEFYVQVSGDDIISANNEEEIHSDTLKAKLESGELTLDGIQVNKSGKVSDSIQADMDYKSCSKILGDFKCNGGTGGYLGGSVESVSYTYNEKNAKVILHFSIPSEIAKDLSWGKINSVSAEHMKSYNPILRNVVIRKEETVTTMETESTMTNSVDLNINNYNSKTAYIKIWNEFRTLNGEFIPEGKAFKKSIKDDNYDILSKLSSLRTIYFNNGKFTQFSSTNQDKFSFSGDFLVNQDGKIKFEYQRYDEKYIHSDTGEEKEIFLDIKNENTNLEEGGRKFYTLLTRMKDANNYGYILKVSDCFNPNDKFPYISTPHYYNVSAESENWKDKFRPSKELNLELYSKGNLLVAKQKGYSFDGDIDKKEFTLKYDDSDIVETDRSNLWQMTIKFNSDNTWKNDLNSGYSGTWQIMYDNLLVIYPPKNEKGLNDSSISMLYLDFDNREIYVPIFIKCDDMIEIAEEYENIKN